MRFLCLVIFLLFPATAFSQFGLKYGHLNWNLFGHFDAPNFDQFVTAYNSMGPKPSGADMYGFRIRRFHSDALSLMTGWGVPGGKVLFTTSFSGGTTSYDTWPSDKQLSPNWKKSLSYDYTDVGIGLMFHLFESQNENSLGYPRIEYQIGLDREFDVLEYQDESHVSNKYKSNNLGLSSFIQYNFYTPYYGDRDIRFVIGINLGYHKSLNPIDFSAFQNDLNFSYGNKLSDTFKDITFGFTLGMLSCGEHSHTQRTYQPKSKVTATYKVRTDNYKVKTTDHDTYAYQRNPESLLELGAVDLRTQQNVNAQYDVVDDKRRPVPLVYEKYIPNSVFKKSPTIFVTARANGYIVNEVQLHGKDTLQVVATIELSKISGSPVGAFYFEQSTTQMIDKNSMDIDSLMTLLDKNPLLDVSLVGHTSAEGSSKLNKSLSTKRAKVIRELLIKEGILKSRIQIRGVGELQPAVTSSGEKFQSKNRRVEVFLVKGVRDHQ